MYGTYNQSFPLLPIVTTPKEFRNLGHVVIAQGCECPDLLGREVLEKLSRDKQIPQEKPRKEVRIRWTGVNRRVVI